MCLSFLLCFYPIHSLITPFCSNLFFSPASSSHSHTHLSSLSSISSSFFLLDFNFPSPFAQANSIHDEPVQSRKARVHYRTLDWTSSGLLSLRPVPKRLPRASGRKVHTRHENGQLIGWVTDFTKYRGMRWDCGER